MVYPQFPSDNKLIKWTFLDKPKQQDNEFILKLQLNKTLKEEDIKNKVYEHIKIKIDLENVATYYQFAVQSNNPKLTEGSLTCIARSFSSVVKTNSFLELGYKCVAKILWSRGFNLSSQLDVLRAVSSWIKHNIVSVGSMIGILGGIPYLNFQLTFGKTF